MLFRSWENSNYVFVYAICKNGKIIDFTNNNTYVLPFDASETDLFSVRAANEMGGLGKMSNEVTLDGTSGGTGIEDNYAAKEVLEVQFFNANGVRISAEQQGINIVRIIYTDGSIEIVKKFVK